MPSTRIGNDKFECLGRWTSNAGCTKAIEISRRINYHQLYGPCKSPRHPPNACKSGFTFTRRHDQPKKTFTPRTSHVGKCNFLGKAMFAVGPVALLGSKAILGRCRPFVWRCCLLVRVNALGSPPTSFRLLFPTLGGDPALRGERVDPNVCESDRGQ